MPTYIGVKTFPLLKRMLNGIATYVRFKQIVRDKIV